METCICTACGTEFPPSNDPPSRCPICDEERQFLPGGRQGWIRPAELARAHRNSWRRYEPGLFGIGTVPDFAIGQRALLLVHPEGNILWDCVALLDPATEALVAALGGIRAIAISHPHYYTSMVSWSRAFEAPIHLHRDDRAWVMRPDPAIQFWDGDRLPLAADLTLLRLGGHFAGGTVLHAAGAAEGEGALLTGDVLQVAKDTQWVSFMWSYPNFIPLSAATVTQMMARLGDLAFSRLYGAFWDSVVQQDARAAVDRSAARYVKALQSR